MEDYNDDILIQVVSIAVAATLHLHLNPHRRQPGSHVHGIQHTSSNRRTNHVCKYNHGNILQTLQQPQP